MVREKLAEYAHKAWSSWMDYLFEKSALNPDGTVTIPAREVERWTRQAKMSYADLPEHEKESDRKEADCILQIFHGGLTPCKLDQKRKSSERKHDEYRRENWHDDDYNGNYIQRSDCSG